MSSLGCRRLSRVKFLLRCLKARQACIRWTERILQAQVHKGKIRLEYQVVYSMQLLFLILIQANRCQFQILRANYQVSRINVHKVTI